ncbi:sulfite exporter TauE/SafE family protein [Alkalicoccobacillus gibsonii]|uniref:sulfite exporter TauE/SafE family protein n=1 Tax=Alkalicoccobacillus gibsonii TaxID=79881 RepID=UPI003510E4D0
MTIVLFILLGLIASSYGVIIGAGGGFIFVPLLLLFYDITPAEAAGTGLLIVLISSLSGVFSYIKQKRVNYKIGLLLAIGAIPGTFLGNTLISFVPEATFYKIFALMLLGLGFFLIFRAPSNQVNSAVSDQKQKFVLPLIGIGIGTISSFFGIGGGFIVVPILVYLLGLRIHIATATSVFALIIYSSIGSITPLVKGNVDWIVLAWSGIGVLMGSQLGAFVSKKLDAGVVTKMLASVVILMGVLLIW